MDNGECNVFCITFALMIYAIKEQKQGNKGTATVKSCETREVAFTC